MFRRDAVKPDFGITRADLAMDSDAVRIPVDTTCLKSERVDEEIVGDLNVLVDQ